MNALVFNNPGVIDPLAILTFGVSAKDNPSAIGMFGTGLKYAIAVLMRNGYKIDIHSGDKLYQFTSQRTLIRNDEFDIVFMNEKPAGFTTAIGKFWKSWMAIRELASNAMDEKGSWNLLPYYPTPGTEDTTIVVSGPDIDLLYNESKEVFLNTKPIFEDEDCDIHNGRSDWIYYRGIRAMKLACTSIYTYNIKKNCELTEDRTIKHSWNVDSAVLAAMNHIQGDNIELLRRMISAGDDSFESDLNYSWLNTPPSEVLAGTVAELVRKFQKVPLGLREACRNSLLKTLNELEPAKLDPMDVKRLEVAISFCNKLGFKVDTYQITVTDHLGVGVLGRAMDDKIYISMQTFSMGTKMLVGTLIEEYIHLKHQLRDNSREMQNFLFDRLVSFGERMTGEML